MKRYIEASRSNAFIGIWWYTDDKELWCKLKPTDQGALCGNYFQYDDQENHLTLWRQVVNEHISDPDRRSEIIAKGYKSFERGRVIYNTATQCYEVICSAALVGNKEFQDSVVQAFQLSGNRVEFCALSHYHKAEITGNPALDSFEYGV